MNIYIITNPEKIKPLQQELRDCGNLIPLTSGNSNIGSYAQLFTDDNEKILVLNPGIIEWKLPIETLDQIKNLRGICTSSAWTRFIDFDYCKSHQIVVTHTNGANSQSVAEYAIWMMFSLARQLPSQIKNNWQKNANSLQQTELIGKTIGVIGLGNIGSRVAKLSHGLGMNVIYWNRSLKQSDFISVSLDDLLRQSDVVVNCLEICPETQGFLNKEKLNLMKFNAFFVSVLGGMGWGIQDDQYLIEMVANQKISGFAVENEHKGTWPTVFEGNIFVPIASAHNTKEADERIFKQWVEAIKSIGHDDQKYRVV